VGLGSKLLNFKRYLDGFEALALTQPPGAWPCSCSEDNERDTVMGRLTTGLSQANLMNEWLVTVGQPEPKDDR